MQQEVIVQSTRYTDCAVLVSPTGFEGLCLDALHAWNIPFRGKVVAA